MIDNGILEMLIRATEVAVEDYKHAIDRKRQLSGRCGSTHPEVIQADKVIHDCERYFRDPLFSEAFPNIDPEHIINTIRDYDFKLRVKRHDG